MTCADDHENVVSVSFGSESAQVTQIKYPEKPMVTLETCTHPNFVLGNMIPFSEMLT